MIRHDRIVPRITVTASVEGEGLDPGLRTQRPWTEEAKRELTASAGWPAGRELGALEGATP